MNKRVFLLLTSLFFAALVSAAIGPAVQLTELPACYNFAGKNAVYAENGIIHMVSISQVPENGTCVIYARKAGDSFTYHIVDNDMTYTSTEPTLLVDGNSINVFYTKRGKVMKATSTDGGSSFSTGIFEKAADKQPLVCNNNGEYTSFITSYDQYSDSLYTSFTGINEWPWDAPAYYWGPDVVYGPLRVNGDLWIKQAGGGNNNGWPTFYGPVYTSGIIQSFSGTPPYAQVFHDGYYEHVDSLFTDNTLLQMQIMESASIVGPTDLEANRIMFVTVEGNSYWSWVGNIVQTGIDTLLAWSSYPPGTGDPIFSNVVAHLDTLWAAGPTWECSDRNNVVNSQLWIRGNFSGNQVWYSPFDIKLVDDITLTNTPVGQSPDGSNGNPINTTDYVALVSGGQIQVQYGYRDPIDSLRYHPNCGSDTDGIWIYASLYSLKPARNGSPWDDGCFTFEYQRPHPSTPDYNLNGTIYDRIDLHRRQYPQTAEHPWPGNIDLPYYNPLWPERFPLMERGSIRSYGSVYQYRRGFTHRSILDSDYPNPGSAWDLDIGFYGGGAGTPVTDPILGFAGQGVNSTGATGGGVGYKKDYHNDYRIGFDTFGFNPFGLGIRIKDSQNELNWYWRYYQSLNEPVENKSVDIDQNIKAFQFNNHIVCQTVPGGDYTELNPLLEPNEHIRGMQITSDNRLMINVLQNNEAGQDSLKLVRINPADNNAETYFSLAAPTHLNTMFKSPFGTDLYAVLEENGNIRFYDNFMGEMQSYYVWNPGITEWPEMNVDLDKSRLIVLPSNNDTLDVLIAIAHTPGDFYNLYQARGVLEYTSAEDNTEIPLTVQASFYPNPFGNDLTLSITSNRRVLADVNIYNVKGQKVKTLVSGAILSKGVSKLVWDAMDNTGKPVGNGIYFIKSRIGDRLLVSKVLKIR